MTEERLRNEMNETEVCLKKLFAIETEKLIAESERLPLEYAKFRKASDLLGMRKVKTQFFEIFRKFSSQLNALIYFKELKSDVKFLKVHTERLLKSQKKLEDFFWVN
jgi:hypothetical protein